MKKVLCVSIAAIMLMSCLTGCSFYTNVSDSTESAEFEALPQVEQMLDALTSGDEAAALALMHPDARGEADYAVTQLCEYMLGRNAVKLETIDRSVFDSQGPAGDVHQEGGTIKVYLGQEDYVTVSIVYLSDDTGEGFSTFLLVLGVI